MLRQILSFGLAMTACAAFVPTKANAAFLTFTQTGTVYADPQDSLTFTVSLNPGSNSASLRVIMLDYGFDGDELARSGNSFQPITITDTTVLGDIWFSVLNGVTKDNNAQPGDFFNLKATYRDLKDNNKVGYAYIRKNDQGELIDTVDVVPEPVPEPLTIFGTAMALGGGVLLKRKSFKMKKS